MQRPLRPWRSKLVIQLRSIWLAFDPAALAQAKRLARRCPDVIGVDYGYHYENGLRTDKIGIRYHVRAKQPLAALAPERRLPSKVDGVETDVVEAGYQPHAADPYAAAAMLQPGLSIGNVARTSDGTLGLFVRDRRDNLACLLSNWHVLCGGEQAQSGDAISQPGPSFSGPNVPREVARLRRWIDPPRQYDAAIAAIDQGFSIDLTLLDSTLKSNGIGEPVIGMTVIKAGVSTGVTHALVDGINGHYQIPYDDFGGGIFWLRRFRLVPHPDFHDRDVSLPGDSGSVWADAASGRAIGLHFACEDDLGPLNEYALAHALPALCEALDIAPAI
jgi:endonuclease G